MTSDEIAVALARCEALDKAECGGPLTTFPKPGRADVTIWCTDYVAVIEWLAMAVKTMPAALAEIVRLREENASLLTKYEATVLDTIDAFASCTTLTAERDALIIRRDELLATIRKLSRDIPYPEEHGATGTLMAQVGTLRAEAKSLKSERDEARSILLSVLDEYEAILDPEWPDHADDKERIANRRAVARGDK